MAFIMFFMVQSLQCLESGRMNIKLKELMQRLAKDEVKEVIIATKSSLEGGNNGNVYQ